MNFAALLRNLDIIDASDLRLFALCVHGRTQSSPWISKKTPKPGQ